MNNTRSFNTRIISMLFISILAGTALFLFSAQKASAGEGTDMTIYGIYLGETDGGDATLVESDGEYLLMDLGTPSAYYYIKQLLDELNVEKLSLYISHLHADHTGGLQDGNGLDLLLSDYEVEKIYIGDPSLIPLIDDSFMTRYSRIGGLFTSHGGDPQNYIYLNVGDTFSFGDVNVQILGPTGIYDLDYESFRDDGDDTLYNAYVNNLSLVARLTCGNTVFLTAGDAQAAEEYSLISSYDSSTLRADIYKISHHGSSNSNTSELMAAVQPRFSFGLNSGPASRFVTTDDGLTVRNTYWSRVRAADYGVVYMAGDEHESVCYRVTDDCIRMYTSADSFSEPLEGLIKLKGGSPYPDWRAESENDPYLFNYYYIQSDGNPYKGIMDIDGSLFNFGNGGCRVNGFYTASGYSPHVITDIDGVNHYRSYDEETGAMLTGWYNDLQKEQIYYNDPETGYRVRGLQTIDGADYLFSSGVGYLIRNQWYITEDGAMYFGDDGAMAKGWITVGENKYYLSKKTGYRLTGITKIGSRYYLLSGGGKLQTSTWVIDDDGRRRYFGKAGYLLTGQWINYNGSRYYLDAETGYALTGAQTIGGKHYYFSGTGKMQKNVFKSDGVGYRYYGKSGAAVTGWLTVSISGVDTTFYMGADGYRTSGVKKIDGYRYLFASNGKMMTSVWKKDDVGSRYFGSDGKGVTGWLSYDGNKYYLNKKTGYRMSGVVKIGKKFYLFSTGGKLQTRTWKSDEKGYRYFGKGGYMLTGWLTYNNNRYYLDSNGYRVTGTVTIDGKKYTFSSKGVLIK